MVALLAAGMLLSGMAPASAAKKHGGSPLPVGYDLSYPQCGTTFPSAQSFGVAGVTGGRASNANPCLGPHPDLASSELYWAWARSSGSGGVARASLYANTADPGNVYDGQPVATWPTSGSTPYGDCTATLVVLGGIPYTVGQNSQACAWEYGYQRAQYAFGLASSAVSSVDGALFAQGSTAFVPPASSYPWWLDVETGNTWQSGSAGTAMNDADIEGMIGGFQDEGVAVIGVYSTPSQWGAITGGIQFGTAIRDWMAGSLTATQAASFCGTVGFSGGLVKLAQYPVKTLDGDVACP